MSDKVGMKELKQHLGVGHRSIKGYIRAGMPAQRSGLRGDWRFSISAVDEWFRLPYEERQRPAAPSTPATGGAKPKPKKTRPGVVNLAALSLSR